MSSMRNAVQRRNHKERAQPVERQKWGLLEKHKDYALRAADHKVKKRKLNALKHKAADRNEDEFYFGMVNGATIGGVKRAQRGDDNGGGKALRQEVVQLMKTQDAGYLRTVLQSTKHDRERLEQEVVIGETGVNVDQPASGQKVVFGDEDDEEMPAPRPQLQDDDEDPEDVAVVSRNQKFLDVRRRRLEALRDQEAQLSDALREVEDQRARMNGTIGGENKHGTKFKPRQRKR